MLALDEPCPECGGKLMLKAGPGRFRRYRGQDGFEIPATMGLPTCEQCGSLWLDSETVGRLGGVFEAERLRRHAEPYNWLPLTALGQLHGILREHLSANTAVTTIESLSADGFVIMTRPVFFEVKRALPQPDPSPALRKYAPSLPLGENRPDAR